MQVPRSSADPKIAYKKLQTYCTRDNRGQGGFAVPTPIKCTAFFGSNDGWGWSETHHILSADPVGNLNPYLLAFQAVMEFSRMPLLAKDRYLAGLRVSYRTATGVIAAAPVKFNPFKRPGNTREGCAPHLAAKDRFADTTQTQFSDVYLRGFWDVVEQDEELNFTTAGGAAWKQLLDAYNAELVAKKYGWLGIDPTTTRRGAITSYTIEADKTISFTITITSGPALPAAGTKLPFRAARLNDSRSTLNRTMVVTVVDATHVRTVVPYAAFPFSSPGTYVISQTTFLQYSGSQYTILARRASGRPFFHSPGRAADRPKG